MLSSPRFSKDGRLDVPEIHREGQENPVPRPLRASQQGSEAIELALQVFGDVSEQTTRGAESINASVATLSERRKRLEREIGRFKTGQDGDVGLDV